MTLALLRISTAEPEHPHHPAGGSPGFARVTYSSFFFINSKVLTEGCS